MLRRVEFYCATPTLRKRRSPKAFTGVGLPLCVISDIYIFEINFGFVKINTMTAQL